MPLQDPLRRACGVEDEGNEVGRKPARAKGHEKPERMRADQRVLDLEAVLAMVRRLIHWSFLAVKNPAQRIWGRIAASVRRFPPSRTPRSAPRRSRRTCGGSPPTRSGR